MLRPTCQLLLLTKACCDGILKGRSDCVAPLFVKSQMLVYAVNPTLTSLEGHDPASPQCVEAAKANR